MARHLLVLLLALCAFGPRSLSAQDEQDTAAARTLFYEGIACTDEGDYPCAVDRFRRSNDLRASNVVLFNLAQAEVELGHLLVASERLRTVVRAAEGELAAAAQSALDAVLPRLATVTIIVNTTASVTLDEREIQDAMLGVAIPMDPGSHTLRALYGEVLAAEDTFEVGEGETATHTFDVPAPAANLTVQQWDEAEQPVAPESRTTRRRVLGVTIGVVAAVGLVVLLAIFLKPNAPDPTQTTLTPVVFE